MVPLKVVSYVSRFKPALNLNWVLADLSRGSNSLHSASGSWILDSGSSLKKIIRIQVKNISLGNADSFNNIKFSNYFSPFFAYLMLNHSEILKCLFIQQVRFGFWWQIILVQFLVDILSLESGSEDLHVFTDPDPGRRNVADETDPNSLHWIQSSNLVWSISTEKGSRLGNHESQLYSLSILVRYNLEIFKRFFQNLFLKFALFTRFLFETKVLIVSTNFKSDSGFKYDFEINYNLIMEQLLV